jgi:RND superfamily putative drug exporter
MTGFLYRLGAFVARHALVFFVGWIVLAAAAAIGANATGRPTSDDTSIPGTDSTRATDLLERKLPHQANGSVPIVVSSDSGRVDQGDSRQALTETVRRLRSNPHVNSVIDPLSSEGASQISDDGKIASIPVFLKPGPGDLDEDEANSVLADGDPAVKAGLEVSAGGYLGSELSQPSTRLSEIVGIGGAALVLVLVLGAVAAMVMPIGTALVGVFTGLAVVGLAGTLIAVPSIAPTLAIMLGLGVGVDYSLFIVTRHRRLLAEGHSVHEAVARAVATSGGAVLFAGGTVVLALLCLYFGGIPQVRSLGYSAALAVAVVILAALTFLPAGLALLGERVNALGVRLRPRADGAEGDAGLWTRWARMVGRHPVAAAALGIALLVVLALPLTQISLGAPDTGQLPVSTTARQAFDDTERGFGIGANGPLLVAVDVKPPAHPDRKQLQQLQAQQEAAEEQEQEAIASGTAQLEAEGVPPDEAQAEATQQAQAQGPTQAQQQQTQQQEAFLKSTASDPRLVKLQKRINHANDVAAVSPVTVSSDGTGAVMTAIPDTSPTAKRTRDLVRDLRDDVIPGALSGTQLSAYVGGTTAANIDLADRIGDELPLVILIIVGLSFVLLTLAYRTVVVPALAALCNLLAVAAAYGVLVGIFQEGWGVELIGLDHAVPVVSYVPLLMFAILFGLSTDYTVFLLTRVAEEYRLHGDHRRATIEGLGRAMRVIVAAAGIMVLVFASFILSGDPTVKQFGVGLAVAVAVDAVIVCLVLPALMLMLGRATWWLPPTLGRALPQLGIEGEEYFAERDGREAKPRAA